MTDRHRADTQLSLMARQARGADPDIDTALSSLGLDMLEWLPRYRPGTKIDDFSG
ncbi:hypothetical protein ACS8Y6_13025 [Salinisphaera sp. RV14]|uniref:hypothetical protein n=1 Tax=unclassified Salinisphaera TaxID=2649847 RepID=UPI003F844F0F